MGQLSFYHHLANLSPRSLGNQIFNLQLENPSLPSLVKDLEEHLTKLGIPDPTSVSKYVWTKKVKEYVRSKCHTELLEQVKKNKKVKADEYEGVPYKERSYLSQMKLEDSRMRMRISCGMINLIKGNFKQKYRKMNQPLTCISCISLLKKMTQTKKKTKRTRRYPKSYS